jgi:hypothetical protein
MSLVNQQTGCTAKPREELSRQESSSELSELKVLAQELQKTIAEQSATMQELSSKNLTLLSQNQELTSKLMTAQEQIASLTSRAAAVTVKEKINQELSRENDKYSLKVENADRDKNKALNEKSKMNQRRKEAEEKAEKIVGQARAIRSKYLILFYSNVAFCVSLAIIFLSQHGPALMECGKWFIGMGRVIGGLFAWLAGLYTKIDGGIIHSWGLPVSVSLILTTILFLSVVGVIGFLLFRVGQLGHRLFTNIKSEYHDRLFKAAVSVDIAVILFFICLWAYAPLKAAFGGGTNIFTIWLLFSVAGVLIWNGPEIVGGLKS